MNRNPRLHKNDPEEFFEPPSAVIVDGNGEIWESV